MMEGLIQVTLERRRRRDLLRERVDIVQRFVRVRRFIYCQRKRDEYVVFRVIDSSNSLMLN